MDIIIHVGLHKTGTTSLQNCLYNLRNQLIEQKILYPITGSCEKIPGHAFIPGVMIPNHNLLNNIDEHRSLDLNYYLDNLKKEIFLHNPKLLFISSEVFSELFGENLKSTDIIVKIIDAFNADSFKIFLSNRDNKDLALSALKHMIRRHHHKNIEPISKYKNLKNNTATIAKVWKNSGFDLIEKFLEKSSDENITKYYIGDIFDTYSPGASNILSCCKEKRNYDMFDPCLYLIFFLLCLNKLDTKKNFILAKHYLETNPQLANTISNSNLKLYLEFLIQKSRETNNDINVLSKNKKEALEYIGLSSNMIDTLCLLSTKNQ